jgi:hypothetical protein
VDLLALEQVHLSSLSDFPLITSIPPVLHTFLSQPSQLRVSSDQAVLSHPPGTYVGGEELFEVLTALGYNAV